MAKVTRVLYASDFHMLIQKKNVLGNQNHACWTRTKKRVHLTSFLKWLSFQRYPPHLKTLIILLPTFGLALFQQRVITRQRKQISPGDVRIFHMMTRMVIFITPHHRKIEIPRLSKRELFRHMIQNYGKFFSKNFMSAPHTLTIIKHITCFISSTLELHKKKFRDMYETAPPVSGTRASKKKST